MDGTGMRVNVYIERLILDGIDVPDYERPHLQGAIEEELARLLVEGGLKPELLANRAVASAQGGSLEIAAKGDPGGLGRQIARALHQGIGRE